MDSVSRISIDPVAQDLHSRNVKAKSDVGPQLNFENNEIDNIFLKADNQFLEEAFEAIRQYEDLKQDLRIEAREAKNRSIPKYLKRALKAEMKEIKKLDPTGN